MSFAEEFRKLRLENMMSQEKIAHKLGVVFGTVRRWEAGKSVPAPRFMPAIMEFCDAVGFNREVLYQCWLEDKEKLAHEK